MTGVVASNENAPPPCSNVQDTRAKEPCKRSRNTIQEVQQPDRKRPRIDLWYTASTHAVSTAFSHVRSQLTGAALASGNGTGRMRQSGAIVRTRSLQAVGTVGSSLVSIRSALVSRALTRGHAVSSDVEPYALANDGSRFIGLLKTVQGLAAGIAGRIMQATNRGTAFGPVRESSNDSPKEVTTECIDAGETEVSSYAAVTSMVVSLEVHATALEGTTTRTSSTCHLSLDTTGGASAAAATSVSVTTDLPPDFNGEAYVNAYPDLVAVADASGKDLATLGTEHYRDHGCEDIVAVTSATSYLFPSGFTGTGCGNFDPDLVAAVGDGDNEVFGRHQYLTHGKREMAAGTRAVDQPIVANSMEEMPIGAGGVPPCSITSGCGGARAVLAETYVEAQVQLSSEQAVQLFVARSTAESGATVPSEGMAANSADSSTLMVSHSFDGRGYEPDYLEIRSGDTSL